MLCLLNVPAGYLDRIVALVSQLARLTPRHSQWHPNHVLDLEVYWERVMVRHGFAAGRFWHPSRPWHLGVRMAFFITKTHPRNTEMHDLRDPANSQSRVDHTEPASMADGRDKNRHSLDWYNRRHVRGRTGDLISWCIGFDMTSKPRSSRRSRRVKVITHKSPYISKIESQTNLPSKRASSRKKHDEKQRQSSLCSRFCRLFIG